MLCPWAVLHRHGRWTDSREGRARPRYRDQQAFALGSGLDFTAVVHTSNIKPLQGFIDGIVNARRCLGRRASPFREPTINIQTPVCRKTAKDFPQELLDLYDFYAHGIISKREFLEGAGKFAIAGVTAAMLLNQLSPDYALAQQVAPDDPDIDTSRITYPSPNGLTSVGGYPGNDDEDRTLQRSVDREKLLNDFFVGFCYGGDVVNALAVAYPELAAGVPFYGRQPDPADVADIKAPMLIQNTELDERINAGWPAYEEALKANGKTYEAHTVSGRQSRLPQRHDAPLRRGHSQAGRAAHRRLLQEISDVGATAADAGQPDRRAARPAIPRGAAVPAPPHPIHCRARPCRP